MRLRVFRLQKPIYVTLIPFATFSLFHTCESASSSLPCLMATRSLAIPSAVTFIRTTVLPKPPAAPAGAAKGTAAPPATGTAQLSKMLQVRGCLPPPHVNDFS